MANKPVACAVCEIHAESVFKIDGMDCREEVAILERRLKPLPGLEDIVPDLVGQRLRVRYDAAKLSNAAIVEAVAQTGMRAWLEHEAPVGHTAAATARQALVIASGAALAAGLLFEFLDLPLLLVRGTFLISILTGGIYTARRAWAATRVMSLDINVLMLVAVVGAMAIGEWSEGATVTFLFAFAQILEARTMDRARNAIRALMDLTPPEAVVRRGSHETRVRVDDVRVEEILLVKPGEKIPLDGVVVSGTSPVNQAPITGESLPVEKSAGDDVFAGTINGYGALDIRVTHLRQDTTLARIIALVELAQAQRAPSQAFVERFARYYTPAVIALAIGIAVVPPFLFGHPFGTWFYRALVLLVISCPCALVISTPVSVVSAIATAARRGVLIKGGAHLERIGSIRCVAFDKTGTLDQGSAARCRRDSAERDRHRRDSRNRRGPRGAVGTSRGPRHPFESRRVGHRAAGGCRVSVDTRPRGGSDGGWTFRAHRQPSPHRRARSLQRGDSFASSMRSRRRAARPCSSPARDVRSASSRLPIARATRRATPSSCSGIRACSASSCSPATTRRVQTRSRARWASTKRRGSCCRTTRLRPFMH